MKINNNKLDAALARQSKNKTDLAKEGVVSLTTFQRIGAGVDVKPKTVGKIARALDVDVSEIIEN